MTSEQKPAVEAVGLNESAPIEETLSVSSTSSSASAALARSLFIYLGEWFAVIDL